jgi:hypothetical protein
MDFFGRVTTWLPHLMVAHIISLRHNALALRANNVLVVFAVISEIDLRES